MSDKSNRTRTKTEQAVIDMSRERAAAGYRNDDRFMDYVSELESLTEPPPTLTPGQEIASWFKAQVDQFNAPYLALQELIDAAIAKAAHAREAATREAIRREVVALPNITRLQHADDILYAITNAKITEAR